MVRYFKKYDVRIKVLTGSGFAVPFETIYDDQGRLFEWGVLQTSDGYIISELEQLIQRRVGGVTEIGQAEYEQLKKKELQSLLPNWRETYHRRSLLRALPDAVRELAAAETKILPAVVRGLQHEAQRLSRPLGQVTGWRPPAVVRP